MRRVTCLLLLAAGAGALTGSSTTASSQVDSPASIDARCSLVELSAVVAGRRRCLAEGRVCRRHLDAIYHRYLFHCHRGYLRHAWDLLRRRPLRVPPISNAEPCPAARPGEIGASVGLEESMTSRVWGPGPAYPFISGQDHAELVFELPMRDPAFGTEWGGTKAIWGISLHYKGPILVRGKQLDGPNEVRFENGSPGFTNEKRLHPDAELKLVGPKPHGNPATTRLRAPGCYAYQVDGRGLGYLVVFEARVKGS